MGITKDSIQLELTIGGEKAGQTLKDLRNDVKILSKELSKLPVDTEEFKKKAEELRIAKTRLAEVENSVKGISQEMAKAGSGFKNFAAGMTESLTSLAPLGAAAAGAFVADKLLEFGKGAVAAFNEAENAAFQMYNAMVTLGGESEESFQRLMDQADLLEQTTFGFTAEQIQGAQKQLKVFGLTGEEIEKLTPKILDYAIVTGKDLAGATDDVTNAMHGKTKALEQVGIHLSKNETTIQGVTNSLDKFGGSAAAALDVGSNKTEVFSDKWGKVEEAVGGFLVNAGHQLLEWLSPIGESLSDLWAILVKVYDGFMAVITPVVAWINRMSEAYPIIGRIKEAVFSILQSFGLLGTALKSVVSILGATVAGVMAGVKTIKDIWGEFATYASDIWGNIGNVIKTAFTDPFNIGAAVDKLKASVGGAAKDIGGTFLKNYNEAMASFTPIPDRKVSTAPNPTDRTAPKGKDEDAAIKAKEKETGDLKKLQEKEDKEAEAAAKKREAEEKKDAEERQRFRDTYNKRLLEGNKLIREQEIAAMTEGLEKEKAVLIQKKEEELQKIAEIEAELSKNTAITEEERTLLKDKYAQARKNIEEKAKAGELALVNEFAQKQAQADNDANIKKLEREEKLQDSLNKTKLAQADLDILNAIGNDDKLLQAKIARLEAEREIELDNVELTAAESALIRKKYEVEIEELKKANAEAQKSRDKEVNDALIGLLQEGLSALSEFSKIAADKQVSDAEKVKAQRIKKLEDEKKRGKITEEKFAKEKEKIEEEANRRVAAIKTEQAKKEKALAVVQSIINTAVAITGALTKDPTGILATIVGVAGALQTALILAKPIPEFSKGGIFPTYGHKRYDIGGIANGASHRTGGIALVDSATGQKVGEMEGGEMYHIYSKETTKNNKWLMDKLLYNSMYQNGAPVFAAGGIVASAPVTAIPSTSAYNSQSTTVIDFGPLLNKVDVLTEEVRNQKTKLEAFISYQSIENSLKEVSEIKKRAGLK